MSIKGRLFTGKMSPDGGDSAQSIREEWLYATLAKIGSGHVALQTTGKKFSVFSEDAVVSAGCTDTIVVLPNHGIREGYLIRFVTTANDIGIEEAFVNKVIDNDTFQLAAMLDAPLIAGDIVTVMRPTYERVAEDGSSMATVESGPMAFIKNGVKVTVTKDANPSVTTAVPVEIVGAAGQEMQFNIAGDAIVSINDQGSNYSSIRIGDGSGKYIGITVDDEAKVSDVKNGVKLDTIASTLGGLATSGLATESKQAEILAAFAPLATELKQTDIITALGLLSTEATSAAIEALLEDLGNIDYATALNQAEEISKLETIILNLGSILTGMATSAGQTSNLNKLIEILAVLEDVLIGTDRLELMAVDLGKIEVNTKNTSDVITLAAADIASIKLSLDSSTPTSGSQAKGTLAMGATTTIAAPIGAKGFIIRNKGNSEGTLHWEIGGVASASSFDLIPLTSTATVECAANISIFASEGSVNYVVQWFTV